MAVIEQESADALRYWATSVKTGNDTFFNAEMLVTGRRLVTKLWNASRLAERRLEGYKPQFFAGAAPDNLLPTDRWLLSRMEHTIAYATDELERGEYATVRNEIERFFWSDLCDNYLELAKVRLYREEGTERAAAAWTLYHALLAVLKLLAPYLPYITEEIYQGLFRQWDGAPSIHSSSWPDAHRERINAEVEETGKMILELLHQVRRYKAEHNLSVGAELATLHIRVQAARQSELASAVIDLKSATRAKDIILERSDAKELLLRVCMTG
jgi:valyl-tRNA synthetase